MDLMDRNECQFNQLYPMNPTLNNKDRQNAAISARIIVSIQSFLLGNARSLSLHARLLL